MFKTPLAFSILAVTIAAASIAQAEVYRCYFADTSVSLSRFIITAQYNTASRYFVTSALADELQTADSVPMPRPKYHVNTKMKTATDGTITWINGLGSTIFTLVLTNTASDGLSSAVYPYEVTANASNSLPEGYLGGCESTSRPAIR